MEGLISVISVVLFWGGGLVGTVERFFPVSEELVASSDLIKVLQTESWLIVVIERTRVRLGSQVLGDHLLETVAWIGCTVAVSVDVIGAGHRCALKGRRSIPIYPRRSRTGFVVCFSAGTSDM